MIKTLRLLLPGILFVIVSFSLQAQQTFKTTPTSVISYLEYLPKDYNSNSNKYPVVIFLHGIGERGPNTTDLATLEAGVWTVAKNGPPKHVKNGNQFPFILISPQLKNNYGTWPSWYVMEVLEHVKTYLRIDERRIHITGLSLGGGGAWVAIQDQPKVFASAAPVCGGYNSPAKACGIAAENLPVWAFHGDADNVVSYTKSVNMVNAINACTPTPSPLAKMTIYSGVSHNAWDRAYALDYTYHKPNLYEWMMSFTNTATGGNKIPVANAGADRLSGSTSLTLTGSGTDSDGSIASYKWSKISGASLTMNNATSSTVSLSGLKPGSYMFKLTVTDNSGNTDSDYVKLTIQSAPVANAGPDMSITLPTSSLKITGSGTDPDGTIVSYNWTTISAPTTVTLTNATSPVVTASGLTVAGNYVLQLEVKDNSNAIGRDQMTVTVLADPTQSQTVSNQVPVVYAGKDMIIYLPSTSATITGTASDADGSIAAYTWSQVSGPVKVALANATTSKVTASGMTVEGFYVFKLTVKDNAGATAFDKVGVTIKGAVVSISSLNTAQLMSERTEEEHLEERVADLSEDSDPYWNDKNVAIYNEAGATIHHGKWNTGSYESVFRAGGFYLYNVGHNGRRIAAGKIVIQR